MHCDWLVYPSHGSLIQTVRSSEIQRQANLPSFTSLLPSTHEPPASLVHGRATNTSRPASPALTRLMPWYRGAALLVSSLHRHASSVIVEARTRANMAGSAVVRKPESRLPPLRYDLWRTTGERGGAEHGLLQSLYRDCKHFFFWDLFCCCSWICAPLMYSLF